MVNQTVIHLRCQAMARRSKPPSDWAISGESMGVHSAAWLISIFLCYFYNPRPIQRGLRPGRLREDSRAP